MEQDRQTACDRMKSPMYIVGSAVLTLALLAPGYAYQKGGKRAPAGPPPSPPPASSFQPGRPTFGPPPSTTVQSDDRPRKHRFGAWFQDHRNLSPEQQQQALERDPKFQELPADRQARLRDRLRWLNSLPKEQRERVISRMGHWEDMSPEQRERWKQFQDRLSGMTSERQQAIRQTFRSLRWMSPEDRQRTFESDHFKQDFSDDEKGLLNSMLDAADADARKESATGPPNR